MLALRPLLTLTFLLGVGSVSLQEEGTRATAAGETSQRVSQFGITWTFDRKMPVGHFANGDWWVVGPVRIVSIDPPSVRQGDRIANGSMVNPSPRKEMVQGYDSSMYEKYGSKKTFDRRLNVAWGVTAESPLELEPHSSLVSTISRPKASQRPQVKAAAILTVLEEAAPEGSFRPPYCGAKKTIRFNARDLRRELLQKLKPPGDVPSIESSARRFERPWLEHVPNWPGRYIHPTENMPEYGREISNAVSTAALLLHLDIPLEQKEPLLVRFVQLGIDLFGVVEDGGEENWAPNGGHSSGRKWPILFAGLMLDDEGMAGIGLREEVEFGADGQTFYVEETSPGVINEGHGGYTAADVGRPDWGSFHSVDPTRDVARWRGGDPYRTCCTANTWYGFILAARIMGAKELWNHDALFDYQDLYRKRAPKLGDGKILTWSKFPLRMWDVYRGQYP